MSLIRFWVTPSWSHIRVEWRDARGTHSADGPDAPEDVREKARACLADRHEHGVPGCEFVGYESREQMLVDRCEVCARAAETNQRGECEVCATCDYCRNPVGDYGPTDADARLVAWNIDQCEDCHTRALRAARRHAARPWSLARVRELT